MLNSVLSLLQLLLLTQALEQLVVVVSITATTSFSKTTMSDIVQFNYTATTTTTTIELQLLLLQSLLLPLLQGQ